MLKLMTRHDTEVGEGSYDSIAWIYETILHEPDPGTFHAAVVHGNEDAPERVELYAAASPMVGEVPGRVWVSIDSFIETVNAKLREYYQTQFPNLQPAQVRADTGPKFHKIVKFDNSGHASAYCFVERKTGNIYKAAGWSAPAKGVRGNISDPWKALDPYGAKSLR